jgi:hypothetical protein
MVRGQDEVRAHEETRSDRVQTICTPWHLLQDRNLADVLAVFPRQRSRVVQSVRRNRGLTRCSEFLQSVARVLVLSHAASSPQVFMSEQAQRNRDLRGTDASSIHVRSIEPLPDRRSHVGGSTRPDRLVLRTAMPNEGSVRAQTTQTSTVWITEPMPA